MSFVSLIEALCDAEGHCLSAVAGAGRVETLVWGYGHLTELGSIEAVRRLVSSVPPAIGADG